MSQKFLQLVDELQAQLLQYTHTKLTWSWICVKLLKLLSNYPSGVTRAIILSELHNEAGRSGGKLTAYSHKHSTCTVDDILDSKSVAHESLLEASVSSVYTVPNTSTKIIQLTSGGRGHIEMYLHKKFYHMTDVLQTHTLQLTCCRLVSGTNSQSKLRLLPTEHMVIMLSPFEERELKESGRFSTLLEAVTGIKEPQYIEDVFAKIVAVGKEEVITTADGTVFRRVVLQLECEGDPSTPIPLVLWDSYIGLVRLINVGDTLFIERPYAKPSSSCLCSLEYAPGTILSVSPYAPQEEIVPSQHPSGKTPPVFVARTDRGKLDYLMYPSRLLIGNLVPDVINAVMLFEVSSLKINSETDGHQDVTINARDTTGAVTVSIRGVTPGALDKCQWAVMCGLETVREGGAHGLSLVCDLSRHGKLYNVERMQGWKSSQCCC